MYIPDLPLTYLRIFNLSSSALEKTIEPEESIEESPFFEVENALVAIGLKQLNLEEKA